MPSHLTILVLALVLDAIVGDPDFVWRRIPHPIALFGLAIDALDRRLNRPEWSAGLRRAAGVAALALLCLVVAAIGVALGIAAAIIPFGWVIVVVVVAVLVAQRDLYDHVARVRRALLTDGIEDGRAAVALIVGRDTGELDEAGVSRAAIESLAENFSDGVVAPAFWFALLGLPGLFVYKIVNTADSMIGHSSDRHRDFGWAAARLDDLLNFIPARLTALWIVAAAVVMRRDAEAALDTARADAPRHRSPNAGWPEAAMAGALGIALGGPRSYGGETVDGVVLNEWGREAADADDIGAALRLFLVAAALHAGLYALLAYAFG